MCFKSEEERLRTPKRRTHNPYSNKRDSQSKTILAVLFYQSGGGGGDNCLAILHQFITLFLTGLEVSSPVVPIQY